MSWFGEDANALKQKAQRDYEKARDIVGASREVKAFRMKIYLRTRAQIDRLFVQATEQAERFNEHSMLSSAEGKSPPERPVPDPFIKLKTSDSEVWSYLPNHFAEAVFDVGWLYQGMIITGPKAIAVVQKLCDQVGDDLSADTHLQALGFLRDQLEKEGVNVDAELAELEESELYVMEESR